MELSEHCVIATVKEGVLIELDHIAALHEVFAKYYSDRNFGYIDNRAHQYDINLSPELYNSRYPKMVGLAIVCYTESAIKNANFEKSFYNWPFEVFKNLDEAQQWIADLVAEEEKKAGL
jgi:hypothetical protein